MIVPDTPARVALEDEILAETRQRKEAYGSDHGFDIATIARESNAHARAEGVILERRVVRSVPEATHPARA